LLEGTAISQDGKPFKTETDIENELLDVFRQRDKINLVYVSGQNIDRLVSTFRACKRLNKIMVVDVYVATILKQLSRYALIPYPSPDFANLRVMFPYHTSRRLTRQGNESILYQFKDYKITKDEISKQADKVVMTIRPSMQKDLERIKNIDGGNLIYSMWEGYLQKPHTKKFINCLVNRGFTMHNIHTSGHADTHTLRQLAEAIKPKTIVPIHTFGAGLYKSIFSSPVTELNDGVNMSV
jgi:ribonuclease J